jgi:hypothetical protein
MAGQSVGTGDVLRDIGYMILLVVVVVGGSGVGRGVLRGGGCSGKAETSRAKIEMNKFFIQFIYIIFFRLFF